MLLSITFREHLGHFNIGSAPAKEEKAFKGQNACQRVAVNLMGMLVALA